MRRIGVEVAGRFTMVIGVESPLGVIGEVRSIAEIAILKIESGAARELLRVAQRRRQSTGQAARQYVLDRFHNRTSQALRHRIKCAGDLHRQLSWIAREYFIATHSR